MTNWFWLLGSILIFQLDILNRANRTAHVFKRNRGSPILNDFRFPVCWQRSNWKRQQFWFLVFDDQNVLSRKFSFINFALFIFVTIILPSIHCHSNLLSECHMFCIYGFSQWPNQIIFIVFFHPSSYILLCLATCLVRRLQISKCSLFLLSETI